MGNIQSDEEDLSAFADYLAEFDAIINFDSEICPVCGINISETLSVQKSPYVLYKSLKNESEVFIISTELQLKGIPFKTEKQLDTSILNEISYNYNIQIPFECLDELKKIKV